MLLTSDNHTGFTIRTTSLVGYATIKFGRGQTTCTPMAHHHQSVFKTVPVRLPGLPSIIIIQRTRKFFDKDRTRTDDYRISETHCSPNWTTLSKNFTTTAKGVEPSQEPHASRRFNADWKSVSRRLYMRPYTSCRFAVPSILHTFTACRRVSNPHNKINFKEQKIGIAIAAK